MRGRIHAEWQQKTPDKFCQDFLNTPPQPSHRSKTTRQLPDCAWPGRGGDPREDEVRGDVHDRDHGYARDHAHGDDDDCDQSQPIS